MKVYFYAYSVALVANVSNGFFTHHTRSVYIGSVLSVKPLRMSTEKAAEEEIYVASEVTEGNKLNKFQQKFNDQGVLSDEKTRSKADTRAGPLNYDGLIDGDTFDGGDGQVGCVGDGSNAMETFDERSTAKVKGATIVTQSKDRQMNAWGSNTGYADKLKDEGMVNVDKYGEDKLKVRRQQLENWRNQQELQMQQRSMIQQLDSLTSDDPTVSSKWKRGSSHSYMDNLSNAASTETRAWNDFKPPEPTGVKSDGSSWEPVKLTGKEKIREVVTCISRSGRPGVTTIQVKNTVMTFEPFQCQFSGDADGFSVEPTTGTLNRRNGEPFPVNVSFQSRGPGDNRDTILVVQTEEDKFVYQIEGRTE